MEGDRDSEICVIVEDTDLIEIKMNGEPVSYYAGLMPVFECFYSDVNHDCLFAVYVDVGSVSQYKAGKFAHSLRMQLMREHCGLLPECDMKVLKRYTSPTYTPSNLRELLQDDDDRRKAIQELNRKAQDLIDPLSAQFSALFDGVALTNTECFRHVFRCVSN
jgi:hypothetical protein